MAGIDLNAIRELVISNQHQGEALPTDPSRQIVVDKEGNMMTADKAKPGQALTQVPQEIFA